MIKLRGGVMLDRFDKGERPVFSVFS